MTQLSDMRLAGGESRVLCRKDGDIRGLKHREVSFKADAVADDGTFTGYASVFGNVDSYGEIVAKGAFAESLKTLKASGDPLPALWQHYSNEPIGGYTELAEDDRGLLVSGYLLKDEINRAREAYACLKARIVKGMSIGYYVLEDSFNDKTKIRTLTKVELVEISIVTFPANPEAQIDAVKAAIHRGGLPTLPEFEKHLREAGFSKTQATAIASRGLSHLLRSESAGGKSGELESIQSMSKALDSFAMPSL